MIYYWVIYGRLAFYKSSPESGQNRPVSVVICARNEYQNLIANLPLVLEQDYPEFEVLVVNDSSDDDSIELLNALAKKYERLKVFNLERNLNFFSGKKFPLALGIKSAKYDLILLTDADCKPASRNWIKNMQSQYDERTEIILGYGAYAKSGMILNRLIRYDAFHVAVQYLSYSLTGKTYMGVGRNLSYLRKLFYSHGGFSSHYRLQSGDDDLFINLAATRLNTRIEIRHESHTISDAKTSYLGWYRQKKRHFTTAKYYKPKFRFLLSLDYFTKLLYYSSFIVLLILKYNLIITGSIFVAFFLTHMIIFKLCADRLNERDLIILSPLFDILFLFISPAIYISNFFIKLDRWK